MSHRAERVVRNTYRLMCWPRYRASSSENLKWFPESIRPSTQSRDASPEWMTPGLTPDAFAVCSMMTFQSVTSFAAAVPIGGHKAKTRQQTRNAPGAAAKAARIATAAVGIITPSLAIAQFTGRALAHRVVFVNAEVPAKKGSRLF